MRASRIGFSLVLFVVLGSGSAALYTMRPGAAIADPGGHESSPLVFVENVGQIDGQVLYYASQSQGTIYLNTGAVVYELLKAQPESDRALRLPTGGVSDSLAGGDSELLSRAVVRKRFFDAEPAAVPEAALETPSRRHFFSGRDGSAWRTGVRVFQEVRYRNLWPGIDLVYRGGGATLKYEMILQPGAEPSKIQFQYEGIQEMEIDGEGNLRLATPLGLLSDPAPTASLDILGETVEVPVRYERIGDDRVGFDLDAYDSRGILTIDPGLVWNTLLGGSEDERPYVVALDKNEDVILAGWTRSPDFPTTTGAFDTSHAGGFDVLVAKLDGVSGDLLWSTLLGGKSWDKGLAITVDDSGNPLVAGWTQSPDFPTTPGAHDSLLAGTGNKVFVVKFDPTGADLLWSTLLGGSGDEACYGLQIDPAGDLILAGWTNSADFPTTPGVVSPSRNGRDDIFVAKMDGLGASLIWSTYLGGRMADHAYALALDPLGNPILAGATASPDFPASPGALCSAHGGGFMDAFVAKLSSTGTTLEWGTFVGGSEYDEAWGVHPDAHGDLVIAGRTRSADFPTSDGAYDRSHNGGDDAFVAKLGRDGTDLLWSTYLGGQEDDLLWFLDLDSSGKPLVGGTTLSPNFPATPNAYDPTYNGEEDAFLAKLDASGTLLLSATYLGGSAYEHAFNIDMTATDDVVIVGETLSPDFPSLGKRPLPSPRGDLFVVRMKMKEE